jgi:hypothetical protein
MSSSAWPLTVSMRRPVHSMLMPYSQRAPGSNTSGWRKDATLPVARLGIPVALM